MDPTGQTCGEQRFCGSVTTLSTIAIQTGQTQITASVLQSGSVVHLQLVQFQPGLCEIGSNQEENQVLIQDHQQLLEKLQKHESEVLMAAEKKAEEKLRKKIDEGMMAHRRNKEEELNQEMKVSLSEGWSLLLHLLQRQLEVLHLASDFYRSATEMSISIRRLEDLKVTPGEEGLTGVQVSFNSMRREILEKSFQVLTSYSVLQQNLRQLQRIEALQRRGGGELREEKEEANQSSQSSGGAMLRLEQLMEILQNQRWKAEQVFRLQLQWALEVQGSKISESQDQTQLDRNLQPESRSEVPEPWPWDSRDPRSESGSEQTKKPEMESRPLKTRDVQSSFRSGLKTGSGVKSGPSSESRDQAESWQNQELMFCRKDQERLQKNLQDLKCVSELLDSCTLMDLGSDLQTSRLLTCFREAEAHFRQLDAEVEEILERVQTQVEEVEGGAWMEKLLKLQLTVKEKIQQSKSILSLSRRFHLTANKLELLLQSEHTRPGSGSTSGSSGLNQHQEAKQQIQNLMKTTSALKLDLCRAVSQSGWARFQVEQLEARLHSLNLLYASWWNQVAQQEKKLTSDQLINLLHNDIIQELRTPAGAALRLRYDVQDGGVGPRQVEDSTNELQRQMGDLDSSMFGCQRTLKMTCRLQKAIEEHQRWCEKASAIITQVKDCSLECGSTEAVSVLFRQFEKFVWPTVPEQEERIGQMCELAIRLHGEVEGPYHIQKMISKHSAVVESIRELSERLMELKAKLKNLEQRKEKMEEECEERREREPDGQEKKPKGVLENHSTLEAADMYELKETGHTPEQTFQLDGKEAALANRTAWLEAYNQAAVSESSIFFSSLLIHKESQHVPTETWAMPPRSAIGPSFSIIKFQDKTMRAEQQDASVHVGLHQREAMVDFLSSDEYDCASPDDVSLPPLAETAESNVFQSNIEQRFSSHCIHASQCLTQAEPFETGPAAFDSHQKEFSQTEDCPSPSVSLVSSMRFLGRDGSSSPGLFLLPADSRSSPVESESSLEDLKLPSGDSIQSLVNSVQPPANLVQSPADSLQPPVNSVQPPADSTHPPADLAQPPADSAQPTSNLIQPSVDSVEPPVDSTHPPADLAQPSADSAQPPADSTQPPADSTQPPTDLTQPPTDLTQPPTDLTQPTVNLIQPPVNSVQPPADSTQPPADLAQPPADLAQPTSNLIQPSVDSVEPPVDSTHPPADLAQPSADLAQPTANSIQQTANSTQPSVDSAQPPTDSAHPPADSAQPPADSTQPPADSTQPPTDLTQPPTDLTQPPTDLTQPTVNLIQPSVDSVQPPTDLAQPPVNSVQPPADSTHPPADLAQPSADSAQPTANSIQPSVDSTQQPTYSTQPPADSAQLPVDSAQPPADSTQPPADSAQPPSNSVQPSVDSVQPPTDSVHPQADLAQPPTDLAQPPADSAHPPADSAHTPTDSTQPPTDSAQPPTDLAQPPVNSVHPPADSAHPTSNLIQPPADSAQPPTDLAQPPVNSVQPPADSALPPADLAQPPTDLAQPPADLSQPPADSAQPPTDLAQPPVNSVLPPADSPQPPANLAQPPTDSAKPPTDLAQPPVNSVQPPADSAQPPANSAQPPANLIQPSVDSVQPPADLAKLSVDSVFSVKPSVDLSLSSANSLQPLVDSVMPLLDSVSHSVNMTPPIEDLKSFLRFSEQPLVDLVTSVESVPPSVDLESFAVDSVAPTVDLVPLKLDVLPSFVDSDQHLMDSDQCWVDSHQPLVDSHQHLVDSNQPLVDLLPPLVDWELSSRYSVPSEDYALSSVDSAPPSVDSPLPSVYSDQPLGDSGAFSVDLSPPLVDLAQLSSHRLIGNINVDQWVTLELSNVIFQDWNTWFGTLCVLLWLLYLMVL